MKRAPFIFAAILLFSLTSAPARHPDYLWFQGGSTTVTPGTPFTVQYYTQGDQRPIRLRVYRIGIDRAIALVRARGASASQTPSGDLVWQGNANGAHEDWARAVSVGPFPVGLYEIRASLGKAAVTTLANVTTLGVMHLQSAGALGAWAIDLRTFRAHQGPTSMRLTGKGLDERRAADIDGLTSFAVSPAPDTVVVAQSADGSTDVAAPYWYGDANATNNVQYVQTDRPVYRPGQTVQFRAILRTGYEEGYRIPSGLHRVEVDDNTGSKIYTRKLALSPFGTLSGSVVLPQAAQLGYYQISIDGANAKMFAVQAYKKPEYLLAVQAADDRIVGGDDAGVTVQANYVFGRPAAGMKVHYTATGEWGWQPFYDPFGPGWRGTPNEALPNVSGDAVTDSQGRLHVRIPTVRAETPYSIAFAVSARDNSGRTVSTQAALSANPAEIALDLEPSEWYANRGDDVALNVTATHLHGAPAPGQTVDLRFTRQTWDEHARTYDTHEETSAQAITSRDGNAVVHWRPRDFGVYVVSAQTRDRRGNFENVSHWIWVMGGDDLWMPPTEQPVLVPAHATLSKNERPRVLVRLPAPNRDVLIAVVSDQVRSLRVLHVTGYAASLGFDAPPNAAAFSVQAFLPSENGFAQAQVQFKRAGAPKQLRVVLKTNRKRYEPRDGATFDALVTDANGKPVRTELSIGIVDDAIYAVQDEAAGDPVQQLYGNTAYINTYSDWYRPNYMPVQSASEMGVPSGTVRTIAKVMSRAAGALVRPGTASDMYSVAGATHPLVIRNNFLDTAYWTPAVVTDARGRARIRFDWPDNLTTWRTTALGITAGSDVGQARMETLVTKDFLVRLETPRFLRKGDASTIVGIAQGQKDARKVRLSFEPDVHDPLSELLELDQNDSATAIWPLQAGDVLGERTLTLTGSDGARRDAMQLTLPVEAAGAAEHVRDAGDASQTAQFALSLPQGYDAGALRITLTPSVAAQLLESVRVLDVYPYYCTEQTMSAALPAVFVDRLFRRSGLELPSDLTPAQVIAHAIDRLSELQHDDGSWGWWEHDDGHPFMTAYAVYGLAEFKKSGYRVPDTMLARGIDSLVRQLDGMHGDTLRLWGGAQPGSEWNTRAFMLFSLADADAARVDRTVLEQTADRAHELNSYALAVLGLTYHELGDDSAARRIAAILDERAVSRDSFSFWSGDTWHYAWEDDPIETTAYAVRLNVALHERSELVDRAVAFLRAEQHGAWWFTTKDTAAAVYAITEAQHPSPQEFHPDETVSVVVGDRTVRTLRVDSAVLDAADAEVEVPASELHDGTQVHLVRSGRGALYWSSDFTRYAPWNVHAVADSSRSLFARLFPKQPPLRIERSYSVDRSGTWRVGDLVHVNVTVTASEDVQYVAVEDPFPAGLEYAPPQGESASSNWSGVQFFDDRAVFFEDRIDRSWPLHLSYDLRVTTEGRYSAPPPTAYAMYGPPVTAVGSGEHVVVRQ